MQVLHSLRWQAEGVHRCILDLKSFGFSLVFYIIRYYLPGFSSKKSNEIYVMQLDIFIESCKTGLVS